MSEGAPGPRGLVEVARDLGIPAGALLPYGRDKAKVDVRILRPREGAARPSRLVLVSAITPTAAGEGKTTTSIGLADALRGMGYRTCLALREPSLGPCLGRKGGGTGGGRSQLHPAVDINLHFTGDLHAVTTAHNLIAATVDKQLHFDEPPAIDPARIEWRRVMDLNDRALRNVRVGLGGTQDGPPRDTGFDITASSELMAMLCLAADDEDLRRRVDRTLVGYDREGRPVLAAQLGVTGAVLALLRDALLPNLVQTLEGTPALVHGGPFANIAHGCSSVIATRLGLACADWVVTEAGFGFDLGAEKFFDLKATIAGLDTAAVVLVATVRALKMHGGRGRKELDVPDVAAVERGLANLDKHVENIHAFGERPIVALNRFAADTDPEIRAVRQHCARHGVPFAVCDPFGKGGAGSRELAKTLIEFAEKRPSPFRPLYEPGASPREKIATVARTMYGADEVRYLPEADRDLERIAADGFDGLPVCISKTHTSLTDEPRLRGRPEHFDITVRRVLVAAGAGFLVVLTGDLVRMPGLVRHPRAENVDLVNGRIVGLLEG